MGISHDHHGSTRSVTPHSYPERANRTSQFARVNAIPAAKRKLVGVGTMAVNRNVESASKLFEVFDFPRSGLVRLRQILAPSGPVPVGKSSWWAGVKSGRFPAPLKLGPRTTVWRAEDIRNLIDGLGGQPQHAAMGPNLNSGAGLGRAPIGYISDRLAGDGAPKPAAARLRRRGGQRTVGNADPVAR